VTETCDSTGPSNRTKYVYDAQGQLAAEFSSQAPTVTGTEYLIADHLGSTRMSTNSSGGCLQLHDYLPFGEDTINTLGGRTGCYGTSDGVAEKFTGKERDAETGLDFMEARYFSSAQGRFTSPDEPLVDQSPYDPQSWNLYAYVRNNPLRWTDPHGRKCVQTSNGPADDGTGGGCEAAGVDANGKITPQQVTVGVGRDEANLIMLSMIGDAFTAHGVAQFASDAAQATGNLTGATAVAQCLTSGITGSGCSKTGVAMAILPGALGSSGRAIRILEEVAGAIHLEVQGAKGTYEVIANITREGDTIILEGAHMQGSGAGQFGGKELLKEIREAAKQFGKEQGAKEVVIQGGARTSGANPGHVPPPIRIKVN